jgi:hypothetical protein
MKTLWPFTHGASTTGEGGPVFLFNNFGFVKRSFLDRDLGRAESPSTTCLLEVQPIVSGALQVANTKDEVHGQERIKSQERAHD